MYKRSLRARIEAALADTPVVLVNGARQVGKTTLVQEIARTRPHAVYRTLDDAATLAAAAADPGAFARQSGTPLVIDEVQRVPELFPAIKREVDLQRKPGRYLLTGSANMLLLPRLSESLTGRMEIATLRPLSQSEIEGTAGDLIRGLLRGRAPPVRVEKDRVSLADRVVRGGYPEAVARRASQRRAAWFGSYVMTLLQREVRDLSNIAGLTEMPRLLTLLAARTARLMNVAELSRDSGMAHNTLKRYLSLLRTVFVVQDLPAWSRNVGKRLIKASKVHLTDSGLAAYLLGADAARMHRDPPQWGHLLETFVVNEILTQVGWLDPDARATHFRSCAGRKVDLVLEDREGHVVGIEVKASSRIKPEDFDGLKELAETARREWTAGVVLYTGEEVLPFGDRLWAVPVHALWCPVQGARGRLRSEP